VTRLFGPGPLAAVSLSGKLPARGDLRDNRSSGEDIIRFIFS